LHRCETEAVFSENAREADEGYKSMGYRFEKQTIEMLKSQKGISDTAGLKKYVNRLLTHIGKLVKGVGWLHILMYDKISELKAGCRIPDFRDLAPCQANIRKIVRNQSA